MPNKKPKNIALKKIVSYLIILFLFILLSNNFVYQFGTIFPESKLHIGQISIHNRYLFREIMGNFLYVVFILFSFSFLNLNLEKIGWEKGQLKKSVLVYLFLFALFLLIFISKGKSFSPTWINFISTTFISTIPFAFFEEIMCRGIILKSVSRTTNPSLANLAQSLIFGLLHFMSAGFYGFLWSVPFGFLLGYITIRKKSLLTPSLMHSGINALIELSRIISL